MCSWLHMDRHTPYTHFNPSHAIRGLHTATLHRCGHSPLRQLCHKSHCVSSPAPQHQHEASGHLVSTQTQRNTHKHTNTQTHTTAPSTQPLRLPAERNTAESADYMQPLSEVTPHSCLHHWASSSGFPSQAVLLGALSLGVPGFDVVCGEQPLPDVEK